MIFTSLMFLTVIQFCRYLNGRLYQCHPFGGTSRRSLFLTSPHVYIDANVLGFTNILKAADKMGLFTSFMRVRHQYTGNTSVPFSERDSVDHPINLYAATKKANELMAHTYSHLYGLPTTGLRFFTVYTWGRPDMALFIFAKSICKMKPLRYLTMETWYVIFFVDDIVRVF